MLTLSLRVRFSLCIRRTFIIINVVVLFSLPLTAWRLKVKSSEEKKGSYVIKHISQRRRIWWCAKQQSGDRNWTNFGGFSRFSIEIATFFYHFNRKQENLLHRARNFNSLDVFLPFRCFIMENKLIVFDFPYEREGSWSHGNCRSSFNERKMSEKLRNFSWFFIENIVGGEKQWAGFVEWGDREIVAISTEGCVHGMCFDMIREEKTRDGQFVEEV